jgi:hypothetical protein
VRLTPYSGTLCRTGSTMFERDLRLWAKEQKRVHSHFHFKVLFSPNCVRGFKFDSAGMYVYVTPILHVTEMV